MVKSTKSVSITIPKTLYDKINIIRGDIPRSFVYAKILENGMKSLTLEKIRCSND